MVQLFGAPPGIHHRGDHATLIGQRLPGQQQFGTARRNLEQQPHTRMHLVRRKRGRPGHWCIRLLRPSARLSEVAARARTGLVFC
ncbi:hypothetical protein [Streptomyces sp. NPDC002088]|uniref:hypothetical protein n=1 Tax=Streptomyces sp. NPDC002088 TaxID=3154665 RepID=UPI003330EA93